MIERIITAAILIPVVLYIAVTGGIAFFILIALISTLALLEFYKTASSPRIKPKRAICAVIGFLILFSAYLRTTNMLLSSQKGITAFIITFGLAILLLSHLFTKNIRYFVDSIGLALSGIFMVSWFSSYLLLIRDIAPYGKEYFFLLLGGIWTVDTAAYFFGTKFGKKRLAKTISPKKTIIGFIAGAIFAFIYALIWKWLVKINFIKTYDIIAFGIILGIFGQLGDLVESMFKRANLAKDTGEIFPGHGGAYDRIDSLIFAAPILYYYIVIFIR
ncbi:MAG: phosphatidate cytidylyltransferase [Elusimicrobia bacterium]|nr:phosphatidate cytidylyltransferase [Elusimicrobiota bacterium]